jgi:uncharacterized membrane protein
VLIEVFVHDEVMFGLVLIAVIAVFLALAYLRGADSRIDEVARRRRYNG